MITVVKRFEVKEVVVKRLRSSWWNCTLIGWPHMVIGPFTVVVARSVLAERAAKVVGPLEAG